MTKALLVIDLQNDYFPGGKFPLWNTEAVLENIERAIEKANSQGIPVVIIQHIAKANGHRSLLQRGNAGCRNPPTHPRCCSQCPGRREGIRRQLREDDAWKKRWPSSASPSCWCAA